MPWIRKTGDVIYDDEDVLNVLSTSRLAPHLPNTYSLELVRSIYRSQTIQVPSSTQPTPSSFLFCASLLPMPTLHFFIPARLPTLDSRMGPQLGRSQEEIAFLWGRREAPTFWTSDDESAPAFHGSIFDPREEVVKLFILKRNGFPSASPVNIGVPIFTSLPQPFKNSRARPTLYLIQAILSGSFVTHPFVLQSQAHEQKQHRVSVPRLLAIHTTVRSCARSWLNYIVLRPNSTPTPLKTTPPCAIIVEIWQGSITTRTTFRRAKNGV